MDIFTIVCVVLLIYFTFARFMTWLDMRTIRKQHRQMYKQHLIFVAEQDRLNAQAKAERLKGETR